MLEATWSATVSTAEDILMAEDRRVEESEILCVTRLRENLKAAFGGLGERRKEQGSLVP